jgi:multidrug resistance efflux pump
MIAPTSSSHAAEAEERAPDKAPLDVHAQTQRLREAFPEEAADEGWWRKASAAVRAALWGPRTFRTVKIAIGLALIAICGIAPARRLFEDTSVDAVVNARLITLRAPIDGIVEPATFRGELGARTFANEILVSVRNPRADRGRAADLARELASAKIRRDGLKARLDALQQLSSTLASQVDAFRKGRQVQLQANLRDLRSQLAAAEANQKQSASYLERTTALTRTGVQAEAAQERADRDATVASEATKSLAQRIVSVGAELQALDQGYFVGDAYNDRPSSRQQSDEVSIRIAETQAEFSAAEAAVHSLESDLSSERRLQDARSSAQLMAPADGRIWELLVSPGEEVARGQDLLRILDCSSELVTGTVRQSVYDRLFLGQTAEFFADGSGQPYRGRVVLLSAGGTRGGNLAIKPSTAGAYHVTVSVAGLAELKCGVGRTGRLVFTPEGGSGATGPLLGAFQLRGSVL